MSRLVGLLLLAPLACAHPSKGAAPAVDTPTGPYCSPAVTPPATQPRDIAEADKWVAEIGPTLVKLEDRASPAARRDAATYLMDDARCDGGNCVGVTDPRLAASVPAVVTAAARQLGVETMDEIRGDLIWDLRKWGKAATGAAADAAVGALAAIVDSGRPDDEREQAILALAEYSRVPGAGLDPARTALTKVANDGQDKEAAEALRVLWLFDRTAFFAALASDTPRDPLVVAMFLHAMLARHALAVDPDGLRRDRDEEAKLLPEDLSFEVDFDCPRATTGDAWAQDPNRDKLDDAEATTAMSAYASLPRNFPLKLLTFPVAILRRLPHATPSSRDALMATIQLGVEAFNAQATAGGSAMDVDYGMLVVRYADVLTELVE